jgi:hypothetical protein
MSSEFLKAMAAPPPASSPQAPAPPKAPPLNEATLLAQVRRVTPGSPQAAPKVGSMAAMASPKKTQVIPTDETEDPFAGL